MLFCNFLLVSLLGFGIKIMLASKNDLKYSFLFYFLVMFVYD